MAGHVRWPAVIPTPVLVSLLLTLISHLFLVFLLLTLNKSVLSGDLPLHNRTSFTSYSCWYWLRDICLYKKRKEFLHTGWNSRVKVLIKACEIYFLVKSDVQNMLGWNNYHLEACRLLKRRVGSVMPKDWIYICGNVSETKNRFLIIRWTLCWICVNIFWKRHSIAECFSLQLY